MIEVMIDLETLSTQPNAIILTLGAIKFNRQSMIGSMNQEYTFYKRIQIHTCQEIGMQQDAETKQWWDTQDEKTKKEAFGKKRYPLKEVLQDFSGWMGDTKYIWSNGSSFDCVILKEAYRLCGMEAPWKYWNERDVRTVLDIGRVKLKDFSNDSKHHSLYDCYYQVKAVQQAFKNIK